MMVEWKWAMEVKGPHGNAVFAVLADEAEEKVSGLLRLIDEGIDRLIAITKVHEPGLYTQINLIKDKLAEKDKDIQSLCSLLQMIHDTIPRGTYGIHKVIEDTLAEHMES